MVDFIKITNAGVNPVKFLKNPLLSFTDRIDRATGELIEGARSAKYRDMRFFISSKGVTGLAGSLHKYYNEGTHNYDDFTMNNLRSVIEDLQYRFGIDPVTSILNNVEFGVNLEVPFNPDEFIDHLVTHNYTQFNIEKDKSMNYGQVTYHQFIIKIYNKGSQFRLGRNVLRFEVKIIRMAKLAKYDIRTLQDLLIPEKLQYVNGLLREVFDQIIYWDDSIKSNLLSQPERELLRDGYNPKFWQDHHKKSGTNASKKFRRYQGLIRKYGNPEFHTLGQLISNKWDFLLQIPGESVRDITDNQNLTDFEPVRDFTTFSKESARRSSHEVLDDESDHSTSSYNLSIGKDLVLSPGSERVCLVTGLNISMQKGTSRFLSTTGIRYYQDKFPGIFKELQDRLTHTWDNEPLQRRIAEIAHSIRNSHHSKRIHTQKAIKKLCMTPSLFNNYDLVSQQKKNIANQY